MPVENTQKLQTYFFFGFLLIIGMASFFVLFPYLGAVILAVTFAIIFHPLFFWLTKMFRGLKPLSALVTVLLVLLIVLVPLVIIGVQVFQDAVALYSHITTNGVTDTLLGLIPDRVQEIISRTSFNINNEVGNLLSGAVKSLGSLFSGTVGILIDFFIFLIIFYYLLKDGEKFRAWVISFSPLSDEYDDEIMGKLKRTVNGVIRGSLVVAIIQGIIAGSGYWVFGVPNAAFWGGVTAISALIPGIGTSLVLIPAILYLFVSGATSGALGLLIWGMVAVGLVDNFLGPKLMNMGSNLHPLLMLMGVIGGISLFGPFGFLIGPLLFSLFFSLLDIYNAANVKER
ncbi:MAG: AI-2E family transporter [Patescibacteria group bacterium]